MFFRNSMIHLYTFFARLGVTFIIFLCQHLYIWGVKICPLSSYILGFLCPHFIHLGVNVSVFVDFESQKLLIIIFQGSN